MRPIMWMKMLVIVSTGTVHAVSAAASQASNRLAAFTPPMSSGRFRTSPGCKFCASNMAPPAQPVVYWQGSRATAAV